MEFPYNENLQSFFGREPLILFFFLLFLKIFPCCFHLQAELLRLMLVLAGSNPYFSAIPVCCPGCPQCPPSPGAARGPQGPQAGWEPRAGLCPRCPGLSPARGRVWLAGGKRCLSKPCPRARAGSAGRNGLFLIRRLPKNGFGMEPSATAARGLPRSSVAAQPLPGCPTASPPSSTPSGHPAPCPGPSPAKDLQLFSAAASLLPQLPASRPKPHFP